MTDPLLLDRVANRDKVFRPFEEAREFVRSLELKTHAEWLQWSKESRPPDIPSNPHRIYSDQWRGYGDWLGTFRTATQDKVFRPFDEAREFVRSLGLKTHAEWRAWCKTNEKPPDIPSAPEQIYSDQWAGTRDWLGTEHLGRYPLTGTASREITLMLFHLSAYKSQTTHARFKADPGKWWRFHELFGKSRMCWPEEPTRYVANLIRKEVPSSARVADMGCGQCLLRDALPEYEEYTGVDHVAYDSGVCAADMAQTPFEDASFDVAVFCLSLLGRNWPDYLTEALRILRPGGRLFIVESGRRWERMRIEEVISSLGFAEILVEAHPPHQGKSFVYAQARRGTANKPARGGVWK